MWGPGGPWSRFLLLFVLVTACLYSQVVQGVSKHQQQHGRHLSYSGGTLDPSPAARQRLHQPGTEFAAAAPRPGTSKQQQVFGSSGSIIVQPANTATASSDASTAEGHRPRVPLLAVTCMSAVMSLMSCLGVLPYLFCSKLSKPWAGVANAVASGVMLAASFGLLAEGAPYGGTYLILGMLLGVVFVKFSQEHLEQYEVDSFEQLAGSDARKVILFLAVMAVHAVGEGGGVGVSFAGDRGWAQGTLVTLAIGLHNIPEGLAVATVMAAKGTSPRRTLLWTALTALPQALVAPPAYVFVDTFRALLPLAMGFAAGCMIWVVLAELLPDALEAIESEKVATCATASAAWLLGLSIWIAHLETPSGTLASPFGNYTAVLPLGITPLLPQLAPVILVPTLLAAAAARLRLPPVLLTAASAGLMVVYSSTSWVQLLLSSPHKLLGGVLAPAVGAAVAAALWRQLRSWQHQQGWSLPASKLKGGGSSSCCSSPSKQFGMESGTAGLLGSQPLKESPGAAENGYFTGTASSSSSNSEESSSGSYEQQLDLSSGHLPRLAEGVVLQQQQHHQQQQQFGGQQYVQQYVGQVLTTPAAPYAGGNTQMRHQRTSDVTPGSAAVGWTLQQQQQQQCYGAAGGQQHWQHPSAAAAAGDACWDKQSAAASTGSNSSSSSPIRAGVAHTHSLLLPGKGEVFLHMGIPVSAAADSSSSGKRHKRDSWGFTGTLNSRVHGSSQAVAAASILSAGGVAAAGVPLGLQLAAALTADPTNSGHVVVPMLLLGVVLSLGCLGFLLLLLGTRRRLVTAVAGLTCSTPVLVAIAALLSQPAWVGQGSARVAADGLQGLAAGFNLLVLLLLLLPSVKQWGPKAVSVGVWSGAAVGLLLCSGVAALCFGTPYCLHVHPTASGGAGSLWS